MNTYSQVKVTLTNKINRRKNKMANRDGTGPEGKGPKTGRQMGNCGGAKPEEDSSNERGFGRRPRGRGMGRNQSGQGRRFQDNE